MKRKKSFGNLAKKSSLTWQIPATQTQAELVELVDYLFFFFTELLLLMVHRQIIKNKNNTNNS